MKAILVSEKPALLPDLRALLEASAHSVVFASSTHAALADIAAAPPDLAIVAFEPSSDALATVAEALRKREDATCHFLVAVLEDDAPSHRMAAYEAGADETVRATASVRELSGLIRSAERITRLEQCLRVRVVELESALRRLELTAVRRGQALAASAPTGGAGSSFLLSRAWTKVEDILAVMCNEFLQSGFSPVARAGLPPQRSRGASIALTDVEHQLNLDLFLCASDPSARAVAAMFCGDTLIVDQEMVRDVFLELANAGMGAVKAAFRSEDFRFATGIPKAITVEEPAHWLEGADATRLLAYNSGGATVHVLVAVRHQPRIHVPATALREGMVLAVDVTNDAGVLIARAGARLTETTAQRISRLVPRKKIDVADVP